MGKGRPGKTGLDYFSFDVDFFDDEKIQFVRARFGIKGEIVAIKLLCKIYRNGFYIKFGEDEQILFATRAGENITPALVSEIVSELVKRGFFDKHIFDSFEILTSNGIQKRYLSATGRRNNNFDEKDRAFLINTDINSINVCNNSINVCNNATKERKGKESKEKNNTPPNPPTGGEIVPKNPPIGKICVLKEYLSDHIPAPMNPHKEKIFEFYQHRQQKPKAKRYSTEKQINGLLRDLSNCQSAGYDLDSCLDIAMEKGWLTPSYDYFKPEMFIVPSPLNGGKKQSLREFMTENGMLDDENNH